MAWMVIRVRGTIHARHEIEETLRFLHLTRPQHATVVPETAEYRGMLTKVQGYVTWGEVDPETLGVVLAKRGAPRPDATPADAAPRADGIAQRGLGSSGFRPLFRLTAPRGGWRSTKKPYANGGALGYRGSAINELARRMV